jgi:hypothetical protein
MNNGSNLSGAKAPLKGRLCRAAFLYFGTLLSFSDNVKTKLTVSRRFYGRSEREQINLVVCP